MKKPALIITIILFLSFNLSHEVQEKEFEMEEVTDWDIMIEALIHIESGGDQYAIGKSNDVGILQITPIYVREVNRILGDNVYSLHERTNIQKSLEMFEVYQSYYNPTKDILRAIKIHNPSAGKWYTDKVLNKINKIKNN